MAKGNDNEVLELRAKRTICLTESLAAMRVADKSDFVVVCGQKEFYVHKVILEASSQYFASMLNSGLQESNAGRIVFKEMEPETLDIILDFLYLGEVIKIETGLQMKKVIIAADMLGLLDLFNYCCKNLIYKLTNDNFYELFDLGLKYDLKEFLTEGVLNFWIVHEQELLSNVQFTSLSFKEFNEFLQFLKSHGELLDNILLQVVSWVQHDFTAREKLAVDVLDNVDFALVTKWGVQMLLKNQDLIKMPQDFITRLRELSVAVLISDFSIHDANHLQGVHSNPGSPMLILFSDQCNEEIFYPSKNCNAVARTKIRHCFQPLDLVTLSWLPVCGIKSNFCTDALCEYRERWYAVGSNQVEMYYPRKNSYLQCGLIEARSYRKIFCFRGKLYVTGGATTVHESDILFAKPGSDTWQAAVPFTFPPAHPRILTSSSYIYAIDPFGNNEVRIQFNSAPDKSDTWETLYVFTDGIIILNHFFIFQNTLHALYLNGGNTVHLEYSHSEKTMKTKLWPGIPLGVAQVASVAPCMAEGRAVLYITTKESLHGIPNFSWDPKNGQWDKLPIPIGKFELPSVKNSLLIRTAVDKTIESDWNKTKD